MAICIIKTNKSAHCLRSNMNVFRYALHPTFLIYLTWKIINMWVLSLYDFSFVIEWGRCGDAKCIRSAHVDTKPMRSHNCCYLPMKVVQVRVTALSPLIADPAECTFLVCFWKAIGANCALCGPKKQRPLRSHAHNAGQILYGKFRFITAITNSIMCFFRADCSEKWSFIRYINIWV